MSKDERKLKQYKSCADCYCYEFAGLYRDGYCQLGFPLEKIDPPVRRRNQTLNDTLVFDQKPKLGCVQKMYPHAPKFDVAAARKVADEIY